MDPELQCSRRREEKLPATFHAKDQEDGSLFYPVFSELLRRDPLSPKPKKLTKAKEEAHEEGKTRRALDLSCWDHFLGGSQV